MRYQSPFLPGMGEVAKFSWEDSSGKLHYRSLQYIHDDMLLQLETLKRLNTALSNELLDVMQERDELLAENLDLRAITCNQWETIENLQADKASLLRLGELHDHCR